MQKTHFLFTGTGFGYIWLMIWTYLLTLLTFGLFFPWASCAQQRWIASNTYINGRQLVFLGSGFGFIGQWILILILTFLTFGLYIPWGYCRLKQWQVENTAFADEI